MKVIHLISGGDVGGAKTHVHTLLAGLRETEDVLLVCFMNGPFAEEARALGIPTMVIDKCLPKTISELKELVNREGFQIIHCHGSRANLIGTLLRTKERIPKISTVHSDYRKDYMGRPLAALTYGNLSRWSLHRMDDCIGVSDITVDMLNGRGFDPNRTFVIFNGVPFDLGAPKLDRDAYLRSVGITPEPGMTVFGIAARINPVKDMGTLIRGFAGAVKVCPKARLIIAGDGEQREQMEALAKELCPPGTVVFAGWIEDTHSFYSALDVNMLTSLSEGFPYALPEGASRRCATIATRVGGVPSLVDHEVNGLLFEPKDVDTLTEYMIRLARDPELVRRFGDNLYRKAKEQFSVEATVARQKEIYETILRREARAKEKERDGILICGAYGKGNSGDDAILKAMVTQLRLRDKDIPIYVTSRSPKKTAQDVRVGSIYTLRFLKINKRLRKTSLYLSGGGSLIQDATSTRSLWYYLHSIRMAKKLGNQVMMFSCGIGPVRWKANRRQAAKCIKKNVDTITLRDRVSLAALDELGVKNVPTRVTADMAFLVEPAEHQQLLQYVNEQKQKLSDRYMVIAPRRWGQIKQHVSDLAAAARYAWEKYGLQPVVLAMEPAKDRGICTELAERIGWETGCVLMEAPEDARIVLALIAEAKSVLGMRLHSLIFAAAQGVPYAGIAYDPKVTGFMDYMGQGNCCTLEEVSEKTLCAMVDNMQSSASAYKSSAVHLRELAEENCAIAFSLIQPDPSPAGAKNE